MIRKTKRKSSPLVVDLIDDDDDGGKSFQAVQPRIAAGQKFFSRAEAVADESKLIGGKRDGHVVRRKEKINWPVAPFFVRQKFYFWSATKESETNLAAVDDGGPLKTALRISMRVDRKKTWPSHFIVVASSVSSATRC